MKPDEDSFMVATINGDTEWFPYNSKMTIQELKIKIEQKFRLKPEQQRLIYKDKPLKVTFILLTNLRKKLQYDIRALIY